MTTFSSPPHTAFPETGTRNLGAESKPLKKGMLVYAYARKLPVQIMMTANKERVMGSEKRLTAHFGQTIWVGFSKPMSPADFATFEDFWAKVRTTALF